ncbi:hypothetical protein VSR34_35040 [Paraburkholderia sp. JHI2823]|uniref:hypothetical protein n=1 Tax=Paraburkholderia sp. JHI2823 TaxID=3112960 RepID=UPI00316C2DD6
MSDLVLPIFPIAPLPTAVTDVLAQAAVPAYIASLVAAFPRLAQRVEEVCGPVPWIVRSAGIEDSADHVNAGGYESLICRRPEELTQNVAAVALSGSTEHARRQQVLSGRSAPFEAISCFVQPLLKIDVADDVGASHSPYLDAAVLDRLEGFCTVLMEIFDFAAIDCEWGLETALGFVSITTIMGRNPQLMNVAHTIGFGFGSAQSTGSRATSLALRPAATDLRLWRGRHLRETTVRRLHLLQARPAHPDTAFRERAALTDDCHEALTRDYGVVEAGLLMLGAKSFGRGLMAPDLMSAWRQYLALDTRERDDVAVVMVDEGSAEEHAGIMFRQQRVTCVRVDTQRVPAGADCVAFDRGTCILGGSAMLRAVRTAVRRELVLPDDCALIFMDEVLTPNGELTQDCTRALSRLRGLSLPTEVKERLLARTEQPMPALWMQRANGVVESPSLLAQIGRSQYSGYAGEVRALTEFAEAYQRAVRVLSSEPQRELPALYALSVGTGALVKGGDLRIAMALLNCEAATFRVPPETLRRLLDSAAMQWTAHQRDTAVLVLESVAFVDAECARLPVYTMDEAVACMAALASAFERGLSERSMASIRSLGLPITDMVRLAVQVQDHPAVLDPVGAFQQAVASFRSIVSGADTTARISQQLNDACSSLHDALGKIDLEDVAEQIRGSLIETYDASLKGLLARTVEEGDTSSYQRYLAMMKQWIVFLRREPLSWRDGVVLDRFQIWLPEWSDEAIPESFEIEDRNWRFEFDAIVAAGGAVPRYRNPHVVHNLLHQWSLAGLRLDTQRLPQRVQALERFCSTFSSRSTKVLRFERELLEIQIPMGTHKASYVFTPRQITVEWTEPPDCPGDEIARILAFEVFLDRFRTWMFPALTARRAQVLGTWTLFIRLGVPASGLWQYEDLRRFVVATRVLFDASYDFSYVGNDIVDGFAERFNRPDWESVITTLVQYRSVLDDVSQYVALHTSPMSSTVGAIARSRVVRGLILRCLRGGSGRCRALIDRYAQWLGGCARDDRLWHDRYEHLRQASLFLAARWPREALAGLAQRDVFHVGDDLIAACLFKRSDLADELRQAVAEGSLALSGLGSLIVRHAPGIAVAGCGAASLAAQLADCGFRFRRAKHFLVARFGDCIDPAVLERLLQGMETVPWGHNAATEQAINAHLSRRGLVCRFELERGIDWTTLAPVGRPRSDRA